MAIKKDLEPLSRAERAELRATLAGQNYVQPDLVKRLLNDLEREEVRSGIYYSGLGPVDGDFSYDADRKCYSARLRKELGLE